MGNPTCPIDDLYNFYEELMMDLKKNVTLVGKADFYNNSGFPEQKTWYDIWDPSKSNHGWL